MADQGYLDRVMEGVRRDVNAMPSYMLASSSVPQNVAQEERRRDIERQNEQKRS